MFFKFYLFCFLVQVSISKYVGDKCRPSSDVDDGICTLFTDCEIALSFVRNSGRHYFNRCGFQSDIEIVCCPMTTEKFGVTSTTSTTIRPRTADTQRIADRECKKIVDNTIPPLDLHIIGGEVASIGEFPHMVGVGFDRGSGLEFDCGGSLISEQFVLTAAHCVVTRDGIEPSVVRSGVVEIGNNQFNEQTDVKISRIITHPNYTTAEKYHDLALLKLERAVETTPVLNAACLYTNSEDPKIPLTISGWGQTSNTRDARSKSLLKANVTVVSQQQCAPHYLQTQWRKLPRGISAEQLCAGDPDGLKDTCQGDSGGPLQGLTSRDGQYRIVGITSFGRACGSKVPGVYTRVYNYLDWIENEVWTR